MKGQKFRKTNKTYRICCVGKRQKKRKKHLKLKRKKEESLEIKLLFCFTYVYIELVRLNCLHSRYARRRRH